MTLTAPGCGMGPVIANDAKQKVMQIPEVAIAEIELPADERKQEEFSEQLVL